MRATGGSVDGPALYGRELSTSGRSPPLAFGRHDGLTAVEAGMVNRRIPDDIVLDYATRLGRAVVTLNWQDFIDLHATAPDHAGIVVCEADTDFAALAARIDASSAARGPLRGELLEVPVP